MCKPFRQIISIQNCPLMVPKCIDMGYHFVKTFSTMMWSVVRVPFRQIMVQSYSVSTTLYRHGTVLFCKYHIVSTWFFCLEVPFRQIMVQPDMSIHSCTPLYRYTPVPPYIDTKPPPYQYRIGPRQPRVYVLFL